MEGNDESEREEVAVIQAMFVVDVSVGYVVKEVGGLMARPNGALSNPWIPTRPHLSRTQLPTTVSSAKRPLHLQEVGRHRVSCALGPLDVFSPLPW